MMSFDTVFWSAPGPCVFATRVAKEDFGPEPVSDLEQPHSIRADIKNNSL